MRDTVLLASRTSFQSCGGNHPPFWTHRSDADEWVNGDECIIFSRGFGEVMEREEMVVAARFNVIVGLKGAFHLRWEIMWIGALLRAGKRREYTILSVYSLRKNRIEAHGFRRVLQNLLLGVQERLRMQTSIHEHSMVDTSGASRFKDPCGLPIHHRSASHATVSPKKKMSFEFLVALHSWIVDIQSWEILGFIVKGTLQQKTADGQNCCNKSTSWYELNMISIEIYEIYSNIFIL